MDPAQVRERALEFLRDVESRHNRVLHELDELNGRIEHVLDEYLKSRSDSESSVEES